MSTQTNISAAGGAVARRALGRAWSRWARVVETARDSKNRLRRVSAERYHDEFRELQSLCRQAKAQAPPAETRLYHEMLAILEPWSELQTFDSADSAILANLELRVAMIQTELGQRPVGARRGRWRTFAVAAALGFVVWFLWTSWQPAGIGAAGGGVLTDISNAVYRLWYRATSVFGGFNFVEITVVLVALAVMIGLFAATRTRSF